MRGERNLPALLSASAASNPRDGCGRWLSRVLASRRDTGVPDTARRPADSVADRKAMDFWKRVESKQEPAKDPERDVFTPKEGEQVAQWAEAAERYQILNAQITALKERLEGLKAEQGRHRDTLKCLMGPYLRAQCGGIRVARYAVAGNIQYERLLQDKLPALPQEEIERYR